MFPKPLNPLAVSRHRIEFCPTAVDASSLQDNPINWAVWRRRPAWFHAPNGLKVKVERLLNSADPQSAKDQITFVIRRESVGHSLDNEAVAVVANC